MLNSFLRRCNFVLWICVVIVTVASATAQTASSTTPTPAASPDGQPPAPDSATQGNTSSPQVQDSDTATPLVLTRTLDQPGVKELGGNGRLFSDNLDWLHWGPLGVRSMELIYTNFSQDYGAASSDLSAATFQTNIAFSKRFQRSWLIWQYNPRVLVVNGAVGKELSNQDSTLDLMFAPSARWTMGVSNWFNFYGGKNTLIDRSVDRNIYSGAILNPFLNNGQRTLVDSIAFPVTYNTSPRTTLSVAPFFSYARTSEAPDPALAGGAGVLTMFQYGVRTQLSHIVSANQSIGMFYTYQVGDQNQSSETTFYQSFGATFSRRLGRSLWASGQIGGSYSDQRQATTWTGVGSITLTKSLRRSSLQGTFGRDVAFSGLQGNGYTDFAWASYNRELTRKTNASAGFGYLSGPSLGQQARGKYVNGTISYAWRPTISCFFVYARTWQAGNGVQLIPGTQSQFQVGLKWSPRKTGF